MPVSVRRDGRGLNSSFVMGRLRLLGRPADGECPVSSGESGGRVPCRRPIRETPLRPMERPAEKRPGFPAPLTGLLLPH